MRIFYKYRIYMLLSLNLLTFLTTNFISQKGNLLQKLLPQIHRNKANSYFKNIFFHISAADTSTNQQPRTNATVFTTQADSASQISGKTSFAVPAPPPLATAEKVRRLSDGEHFRQPNVTVSGHATVQKQLQEAQTQAQAQALADMILKVHFCSLIQDLPTFLYHS